jgi:hypothetical protein
MNALDIQRRLFLASAVGALALRPSRTAQADTNFVNFSFAATGAPTARTMPDRLADITNVKDFGAVGNGRNEDAAAINTAIQYRIEHGGGTVFFPTGNYKINSPIIVGHNTYDNGVRLIGAGKNQGSQFTRSASYSDPLRIGYLVSKGTKVHDCLEMISGFYGIGVKATRDDVLIEDCSCSAGAGSIAIDVKEAGNASVRTCRIVAGGTRTAAHEGSLGSGLTTGQFFPGTVPGSIGVNMGTGLVTGCRGGLGLDIVICMSGHGSLAISNSFENIGCGVRVGFNAATGLEEESNGAVVMGLQTEKSVVGIELYKARAAYVSGNLITGGAGMPPGQPFTNGSYSGGTATMTVASRGHGLPVGTSRIQISGSGANVSWAPSVGGSSAHLGHGIVDVTRVSNTTFSYPLTATPSAFKAGDAGLFWTWPNRYALRCRKVYDSMVSAFSPSLSAAFASIDLDYDGAADANNNVIEATMGGYGWKLPTVATNLASWRFINCRGGSNEPISNGQPLTPYGTMAFANLPGQTGVKQDGPFEGQEFDIIDGSPAAAAFDATISGGGSGKYKVRYNGTNWKRIG